MNITPFTKWIKNLVHPLVIAGPCSAESEEQVLQTALLLNKIPTVKIFRAGVWKPRTRPNSFEGLGKIALPWLQKVKSLTNLMVTTEVASTKHVDLALNNNIDVLWLGARTTANPFLVQEIADALKGVDIPVIIKNPIGPDLPLWIGAIERIYQSGITKIIAIHRGFSSYGEKKYRNDPMWRIPIELKRRFPLLPILSDPSHITGNRNLILEISQKALDLDMDGLMIEAHISPETAMSDLKQQVTPLTLQQILDGLFLRSKYSNNSNFTDELEELRKEIDRIDNEIINNLYIRRKIVNMIGHAKVRNNVTALQLNRMDQLLRKRIKLAKNMDLPESYVNEIFNTIHIESVKQQTDIMSQIKRPITKENSQPKYH